MPRLACTDSVAHGDRPPLKPLSPGKLVAVVAACMGLSALSIDLALPAFSDARAEFGLPADSTEVAGR